MPKRLLKGGEFNLEIKPSNVLSEYTLEKILGKGGQGQVWLAKNKIGKELALKLSEKSGQNAKFEQVDNGSPFILRLEGKVERVNKNNTSFVLMPLELMGPSLEDVVDSLYKKHLPFPKEYISSIAFYMFKALEYLEYGPETKSFGSLVHRDIKPDNILFDLNIQNRIVLADLGLLRPRSKPISLKDNKYCEFEGTAAFASIEQMEDRQGKGDCAEPWDDLESLAYIYKHLSSHLKRLIMNILMIKKF